MISASDDVVYIAFKLQIMFKMRQRISQFLNRGVQFSVLLGTEQQRKLQMHSIPELHVTYIDEALKFIGKTHLQTMDLDHFTKLD